MSALGTLWLLAIVFNLCVESTPSRVVDRYVVSWSTPTTPTTPHSIPMGAPQPPTGPYVGNGDVSVMYTANATDKSLDGYQWLYLSKNDMWGSDSKSYYPHLSAGRVGFGHHAKNIANAPTSGFEGRVDMYLGNGSIDYILNNNATGVQTTATTRTLENNVVLTSIRCTSTTTRTCDFALLLSDTNRNHYGVSQETSVTKDNTVVWWRKENIHNALNSAYVGSCDPNVPLQSVVREFVIDKNGVLKMTNGSCLWANSQPAIVTSGSCSLPGGIWKWDGTPAGGDIVHSASKTCLTSNGGTLGPCGSRPWTINNGTGFLSTSVRNGRGCLIVVPDNNNNTLGVAMGVADPSGKLMVGNAKRVNPKDPSDGTTFSITLQSGVEYKLIIGLQTLRDMGCAGIRPQTEKCITTPQAAAVTLVQQMANPKNLNSAIADSDRFWKSYWGASSLDLTQGVNPPNEKVRTVERWYYTAQYLLASTTRDGKVTSALDGFVCIEPVPWGDQFTLDYNLEATFWGAGSSNRLAFIHPVMASTTNPGAVATAKLRAQNPGAWGGGGKWPGHVGSTVAVAECLPDGCPNFTKTGFRGFEWPSAGMPLGDNRLAFSDLQTRFIGGLLATNLIQYWEYSRNVSVLKDRIYPFVRENAEFYASYGIKGKGGKIEFPYSCAQEACACRDAGFVKLPTVPVPNSTLQCHNPKSPFEVRCPHASGWEKNHPCYECYPDIATGSTDGMHDAHPDIAFAASSFRNAIRFATLLKVDPDLRQVWQQKLEALPEYPVANYTFVTGTKGVEFNGGPGYLVEARYGHNSGMIPVNGTHTPLLWPWCNKEYPISNFAAMWPTDEIGATQTTDKILLGRAKQTVYALNNYQKKPWANTNGFCLSWPPAVRVSGVEDAVKLVSNFATAIGSTTGNNGCVHNHGGMLENIGATVAINDLLLQSHGGRMRFFPVWDAKALGPASFSTLRAYGAFLVSSAISKENEIASVAVLSEMGTDCVFESPWAHPKVTKVGGGAVPLVTISPRVYSFKTGAGDAFTISSA